MGTATANKKYNDKKKQEKINICFVLEDGEIWKPIKDNEKYRITNKGRVFSCITCLFLKPSINKQGYLTVGLKNRKHHTLHRLLGLHFIPNPDNLPCIDHIDRNKQNNNINNLRWASYSLNSQNCKKEGSIGINKRTVNGKTYEYIKFTWYPEPNKRKSKNFKTMEAALEFKKNIL